MKNGSRRNSRSSAIEDCVSLVDHHDFKLAPKVMGISLDGETPGGTSTRTPEALLAEEEGCCGVGTMGDMRLQADAILSEDVVETRGVDVLLSMML
jgi:hypothetical protein